MASKPKLLSAAEYAEAMKGEPSVEFVLWKKASIDLMQAAVRYVEAEVDFFKTRDKKMKVAEKKGKKND